MSARAVLVRDVGGREPLDAVLGAARRAQVDALLLGRARAFASAVADGGVHEVESVAELGAAVRELFGGGATPVLVVWPHLPAWQPDHAAGVLDDLADGCEITLGPMFDGGLWIAGFARPVAALLDAPPKSWHGPDAIGLAAEAARESGAPVGLLRAERGLQSPADVSALLADPLLDGELRALLEAA